MVLRHPEPMCLSLFQNKTKQTFRRNNKLCNYPVSCSVPQCPLRRWVSAAHSQQTTQGWESKPALPLPPMNPCCVCVVLDTEGGGHGICASASGRGMFCLSPVGHLAQPILPGFSSILVSFLEPFPSCGRRASQQPLRPRGPAVLGVPRVRACRRPARPARSHSVPPLGPQPRLPD